MTVALSGPVIVVYALAVALDDRRDAVPARALRASADAVPHRARAGQRERRARSARLDRHAGRAAPGGGAARVHRRVASCSPSRQRRRSGRPSCSCGSATTLRRGRRRRVVPTSLKEAVEGIRAVAQSRDLQLILGLAAAQSLTRGALTVFSVVVAIELLGTGDPGVGALMAAVGVGAVIGSLGASFLVGTGRLGVWFAVGSRPVGPAHRADRRLPAGGGGTVPARLRRRRQRPDRRRRVHPDRQAGARRGAGARLRGAGESGRGLDRASARFSPRTVIEWFGIEAALISIGLLCPVLAVAVAGGDCDAWTDPSTSSICDIGLLQRVPMFHPLPLPAIEQLARGLESVEVPAGERRGHAGRDRRPLLRDRVRRGGRRSATGGSSRRWGRGRASARSRCCAAPGGRRPCVARTALAAAGARLGAIHLASCSGTRRVHRPPRPESTTSSIATRRTSRSTSRRRRRERTDR